AAGERRPDQGGVLAGIPERSSRPQGRQDRARRRRACRHPRPAAVIVTGISAMPPPAASPLPGPSHVGDGNRCDGRTAPVRRATFDPQGGAGLEFPRTIAADLPALSYSAARLERAAFLRGLVTAEARGLHRLRQLPGDVPGRRSVLAGSL